MFRAYSYLLSGATKTVVAASGLLSELGDSSAVGRGRAGCASCWLIQLHVCTDLQTLKIIY
jgi:hypothetical protein